MLSLLSAFSVILPHLILIYGFLVMFTLSGTISLFVTAILVGLLLYYRIPPVNAKVADDMLQADKVSIIAHRGAATDSPENTLGAIKKAAASGADGVEFDLSYTSDDVPVLMHDDSVDRTTNGTGDIGKIPWSYVQTLNAAVKDSAKPGFGYEKVPTLEEAVELCLHLGLRMYIDCKADGVRTAKVMADLYKKYPDLYQKALVCSFYPQVVYLVRQADPMIVTALIHRPWFMTKLQTGGWQARPLWELVVLFPLDALLIWAHSAFLWFLCGNSAFSIIKDSCHRSLVQYFKSLGIRILLWTVNDPVEKTYFTQVLGCDIITDSLLDGAVVRDSTNNHAKCAGGAQTSGKHAEDIS